jgi:hypothetical protein
VRHQQIAVVDLFPADLSRSGVEEHLGRPGALRTRFLEAVLIGQDREPLSRGQPPLGVLCLDAFLAAAQPRLLAPLLELFDRRRHGGVSIRALAEWQFEP